MVVSEAHLYQATLLKFMSAVATVDTTKFTQVGTGSFEASTTAFPNGRSEKFFDFNGAHFSHDPNPYLNLDSGIFSTWLKPDFTQTSSTRAYILDTLEDGASNYDGFQFTFFEPNDDFAAFFYDNGTYIGDRVETLGTTWSIDAVLHLVLMWDNAAGLDDNKTLSLYYNGVLYGTLTIPWSSGRPFNVSSNLGASRDQTLKWNGGMYDSSYLDYVDLAANYTDQDIVDALYSNTYGIGGEHKFTFELESGYVPTPGLTVGARKIRLRTNTSGTEETALEIDESQKITLSGELISNNNATFNSVVTISRSATGDAYEYSPVQDKHTFGSFPEVVLDNPTASYQLVHKKYVDDKDIEILEESVNYTISTSGELVNYIDTEDNILRQYIDTLAIAVTGQGGGGSAYISGIVGEDVSRGQPVYQKESDGLWYLAQATSTQVSSLSIAVTSGTSGQTINFMRYGNLENLIGLPNSKELYLSQTIAGALTETVPTTGVIVYIGISRGTTNLDVAIGSVGFVPGSGGDTTGSGGPRWSYVLGGM